MVLAILQYTQTIRQAYFITVPLEKKYMNE